MNILITGANGFVGSNICSFLQTNSKYKIFKGTRATIDLYSCKNVSEYVTTHKIDTIIHCAIEGGKRTDIDSPSSFYNNLLMYENLIRVRTKVNQFINIASGAEFDRRNDINGYDESQLFNNVPSDFYGLSKNIIAKSVLYNNGTNLRLFGCFNDNELTSRFIKGNIQAYIEKKPIIIHQNKYMDFVYINQLTEFVNYVLTHSIKSEDYNVVYKEKYMLYDIANMINNLDSYSVPITIVNNQIGNGYCGSGEKLSKLNLPVKTLSDGILECYNKMTLKT
jgi:dTDP-4-dehydrorhamnose reductase